MDLQSGSMTWLDRRDVSPRRLLCGAALAFVATALAWLTSPTDVQALVCQVGIECDGRCCTDGYECVGEAPNRICSPPCTAGSRCGTGCCEGACLPTSTAVACCPLGASICEGSASLCCPAGYHCLTSACDGKNYCLPDCQGESVPCGEANCCAPPFICEPIPEVCGGRCVPFQCPVGTTKCGATTCCGPGKTCKDGACVDPPIDPPPCANACGAACCDAGGFCADPGAGLCCTQGTEYCAGAKSCVLPCQPGETRNPSTCACECGGSRCGAACCTGEQTCCDGACCQSGFRCEDGNCVEHCARDRMPCGRTCCPADQRCENGECKGCPRGRAACGTICCPSGKECASLGGLGKPKCCSKGKSCGGLCKSKKRRCCQAGLGGFSCTKKQICCGDGCCIRAKEQCVDGECVPR